MSALAVDLDSGFVQLLAAHRDRVFSTALRLLGDRDEAEDAAQEAFVRGYRALARWDATRIRELRPGPWLATILVNVVRNQWRRDSAIRRGVARASSTERLRFLDAPDPGPADDRPGPADHLEQLETARQWAARLAELPPRYREPIVLRHVDGLAYEEIAAVLGRPSGTVKAQVHRGLGLLRALLEAEARGAAAAPSPKPRVREVTHT